MNPPPQKRRWQFSLKVLFIAITMAGVGMGLIRLGEELGEQGLVSEGADLFMLGSILLIASPGILVGYGYNRLSGAIVGAIISGMASLVVIFIFIMIVKAIFP